MTAWVCENSRVAFLHHHYGGRGDRVCHVTYAYQVVGVERRVGRDPCFVLSVAASYCNDKDQFSRAVGRREAVDRLQTFLPHTTAYLYPGQPMIAAIDSAYGQLTHKESLERHIPSEMHQYYKLWRRPQRTADAPWAECSRKWNRLYNSRCSRDLYNAAIREGKTHEEAVACVKKGDW